MKFAALIVLSLSALALAGPAYNKQQQQQQQQDYVRQSTDIKSITGGNTEAILKKWCQSADMSQEQLTSSFKQLVQSIKSQPEDQSVEQLVMNERICQGLGQESSNKVQDTKVHDYIKDVYMDALIACDSHQCMKQLNKIISSHEVDSVRASYYMTRLAVSDKDSIKDEEQVIVQCESFIESPKKTSPSVERQQMFAATSLIGKHLKDAKQHRQASEEIKKIAKQVATTIVQRYIKPVSSQEIKQYQEQQQQVNSQVAMKVAKRNAALKALANLPGWLIAECPEVQQICLEIAQNKDEMSTARQSAIECLEHNQTCQQQLKQLTFDQEEPTEVRVAAYRALMTTCEHQQQAEQIVKQIVDHCEQQQHQQEDKQFVLYVISHLENLSASQQPEHEQLKECIKANKQMNMKIQLLNKKFKHELIKISENSANHVLGQELSQIESGLILDADVVYGSQQWAKKQQRPQQVLPKLVRVNMSMPVMGETVNVLEITLRQDGFDEHLMSAINLASSSKFTGESVGRIVDSFKSSVEKQQQQSRNQQQQQSAEADLTIKVDGCTVVYVSCDDFKTSELSSSGRSQRNTRSTYSFADEIIEHLKRNPIVFNRGFNFNVNERIAKLLDVDASIIANLVFVSKATGQSDDFELVVKAEPRFVLEAVVGPAKLNKKLLQRLSTQTALGMRLRFKRDQLVDVQLELPQNQMELFTVESKIVEQTQSGSYVELKNQQLLPTLLSNKKSNSVFAPANWMSSGKRGQSWISSLVGPIDHTWQMSEQSARAIGMRGQLRVVVKNTGLMVQALTQKYEPSMQGYRVQVKRVASSGAGNQEQYLWTVSTPGSQIDRTMQIRVTKQQQSGRLLVKTEMKSPSQSLVAVYELIHDGRQYGVKAELASVRAGNQWRHSLSAGIQSSQSARGFGTYKPFVSIKSTDLKRPIEMQGTITIQEEPKFTIIYNLRGSTTENFVQGKLIVEQRSSPSQAALYRRRSMRSPVELVLERDLTLTKEIVAQVDRFAMKASAMLDWDSDKSAVKAETTLVAKNLAKSKESQYSVQLKLDKEQQKFNVERKCLDNPRKSHRFTLQAGFTSPKTHQIHVEAQYHGKRQPQAVVVFKHIVDINELSMNKADLSCQVELVSSEHNIREKFTGRTQINNERKLKQLHAEMTGLNKIAKINVDFVSLAEHQIELIFKGQEWQQQTTVRADRRQFDLQSRTHRYNKKQGEIQVTFDKDTKECQIVYDCAVKQVRLVADLKPVSGKQSSVALMSPTMQSKAEFYFESMPAKFAQSGKRFFASLKPQLNQLRFKTDLKDMINQEAYWMDSHYINSPSSKSFLRMDSPIYRTDIEYDPRVEETKFGLFARSKRSADSYNQLYSVDRDSFNTESYDDLASQWSQKLGQNKMWMIRSLISSPRSMEQLKQKARRALFEYADKRQSQKHQLQFEPTRGLNFDLERKPFQGNVEQSMRLKGDLNVFNRNQQDMRPSTISIDSDMLEIDFETKPFDQEESYTKLSALSRYPRSTFKHNSEYRFQKNKGYKAQMSHEDQEGKRHQWQLEADEEPKRFGKMNYESEKHGKVDAEYNWRKHLTKRSHDDEEVFANHVAFKAQGPRQNQYLHESTLNWEEPRKMIAGRYRRDIFSGRDMQEQQRRYNVIDYLKHIDARIQSRTEKNQNELYNVDFDYKPESHARLSIQMPEDMLHQSSLEYQPTERLYKLQSKLYNRRTQKPFYEISANTKPISGLATAEQEPIFVDYEHSILERPIVGGLSKLFKQPMRLDYTDKFGRVANLDYDLAPLTTAENKQALYAGLRQKRAAVYYKDQDFEHSSSYDFYPETVFGQTRPQKRVPGDVVMKAETKYGPIVLHANSNGQEVELKVETPIINAEISCESMRQAKLFKINLDNKQQQAKLSKIIRQTPILEDIELVKDLAKKIDESRFEHETELLVSFVQSILKLKSETKMDQRQVMVINAELNKQLEKAFVKINGERINGQAVVDLVNKTADLVLDVDDKRTLEHRTRLARFDQDFYTMESMTTYKSKPLIKLTGKICAKIFDASHSFSTRRHSATNMSAEHLTTFEAVIYPTKSSQPKQITGQYDCLKKEARVIYKDLTSRRFSDVRVKFDEQTENVFVAVRSTGQNGATKQFQKTINVSPLVEAY